MRIKTDAIDKILIRTAEEIGILPTLSEKDNKMHYSFAKGCCNDKKKVFPTMEQVNLFKSIVREIASEYPELEQYILGNVGNE